jgi:hypothetical protein
MGLAIESNCIPTVNLGHNGSAHRNYIKRRTKSALALPRGQRAILKPRGIELNNRTRRACANGWNDQSKEKQKDHY